MTRTHQGILNSIRTETEKINTTISSLANTVEKLANRVLLVEKNNIENNDNIVTNIEDIAAANYAITDLNEKIKTMETEHSKLVLKLDDQIDRNMRETLVINGVDGNEKTWEETKTKLCSLLVELDDIHKYSNEDYSRNIVRGHHGGKNNRKIGASIFAKFLNDDMVGYVKSLRFKRASIYINQLRSPCVSERIKKGREMIKNLKNGEGQLWRMFINDNVQLVVKKPGDNNYNFYKQF